MRRSRSSAARTRLSSRFCSSVSLGFRARVALLRLLAPDPFLTVCLLTLRREDLVLPALAGLGRTKTWCRVLPIDRVCGLVVGAFRPEGPWIDATKENFPELLTEDIPGKRGFNGGRAENEVWEQYVGKRVPTRYQKKGAANPVRYYDKGS